MYSGPCTITASSDCAEGDLSVVLHRFKNTYHVSRPAYASNNYLEAGRQPAGVMVSARAPMGGEFVALL